MVVFRWSSESKEVSTRAYPFSTRVFRCLGGINTISVLKVFWKPDLKKARKASQFSKR